MYKRRNKRIIIFLILAIFAGIIAGYYFNAQMTLRNEYNSLKEGVITEADFYLLDESAQIEPGEKVKWRYVFRVNAGGTKKYTGVTVGKYSAAEIEYFKFGKSKPQIRYVEKSDGTPVLTGSEKLRLEVNGREDDYYAALSREDVYFDNNLPPAVTAPIILIILTAVLLCVAIYNFIINAFYKGVERNGTFAYAYFEEATASKLGTNRYMAVKYRYQNAEQEWVEATSPYTFNPIEAERLKEMGTFGVRYKGKYSVIAERIRHHAVFKG